MARKKAVEPQELETKVEEVVEPADPGVAEEKAVKAKKKEVKGVKVTVIPDRLNVRKRPDAYAPVIDILDKNTEIVVDEFDKSKDWTAVKVDAGEGFVMTRYLRA